MCNLKRFNLSAALARSRARAKLSPLRFRRWIAKARIAARWKQLTNAIAREARATMAGLERDAHYEAEMLAREYRRADENTANGWRREDESEHRLPRWGM